MCVVMAGRCALHCSLCPGWSWPSLSRLGGGPQGPGQGTGLLVWGTGVSGKSSGLSDSLLPAGQCAALTYLGSHSWKLVCVNDWVTLRPWDP